MAVEIYVPGCRSGIVRSDIPFLRNIAMNNFVNNQWRIWTLRWGGRVFLLALLAFLP